MGIGLATREWAKYNNEIKTNILVNGITSLAGSDLDNVRVRAMALADYYGQDFNEILNTAKANVKRFLYIEALDSIEDGLVKGGQTNGEFLESMREYPTFFASAGYSIKDFQNLVNSGIDLAIYQDKLPDAIKEFALSVNEQTKGVSDALKMRLVLVSRLHY
jgi:phage-related minor tail protein